MEIKTSFGTMKTLLKKDDIIISELMIFDNEGSSHTHSNWEHCYILEGEGIIVVGDKRNFVKKGDFCKIPPHTEHWMIPKPRFEILLVYSENG